MPVGCGDIGKLIEQLVERGLAVVDGGAFVVGEGEGASMCCKLAFASSSWALVESFGV
jgi:hypothetical protein